MKKIIAALLFAAVGLAGCGGGGDKESFGSLGDLKVAMADAGIDCDGDPAPYEAADDELDFGADPIETLQCNTDGIVFGASRWENSGQRKDSMKIAEGFVCGFAEMDPDGFLAPMVDSGSIMIAIEEDSDEAMELIGRIGELVGSEPYTWSC